MKADAGPRQDLRERVPFFRSLHVQLLLVFGASFAAAAVMTMVAAALTASLAERTEVNYLPHMIAMDSRVRQVADEVGQALSAGRTDVAQQRLVETGRLEGFDLLVTSAAGAVLLKSRPELEDQVDVAELVRRDLERDPMPGPIRAPFLHTAFQPIAMENETGFLLLRAMTRARVTRVSDPNGFTLVAVFLGGFLLTFFLLVRRKLRYLEELTGELLVISRGNLQHRVAERSRDELGVLARSINTMVTELESRIEAERRAERTKSDLITGVSHDLRTPLTSIKGYLDIVRSGRYEDREQLVRYIETAHTKTEQLQEMVEELFEYTKLTGRDLVLQQQELPLKEFLRQMTEEWVPLFEPEGLVLEQELPAERVTVMLDPERFARVLDNLLGNALKYSRRPGTVKISLQPYEGGAVVAVSNPGPAIAAADLESLFMPFFRLDKARTQGAGGSGLGLAIARQIVELHGGRIWAESAEGWVTFRVWLPRAQ